MGILISGMIVGAILVETGKRIIKRIKDEREYMLELTKLHERTEHFCEEMEEFYKSLRKEKEAE